MSGKSSRGSFVFLVKRKAGWRGVEQVAKMSHDRRVFVLYESGKAQKLRNIKPTYDDTADDWEIVH